MPKEKSRLIWEYYYLRETHPVLLAFKNKQVDELFLEELYNEVVSVFEPRDDIDILEMTIVEGDYWSGVLIEFNQKSLEGEDLESPLNNQETLYGLLRKIHDKYNEYGNSITGIKKGRNSIVDSSTVKTLDRDYFKNQTNNRTL